MRNRTTSHRNYNVIATLYSKARATTVIGYKFTATFSERKYIVHKSQTEIKTDLTMNHSTRVISNDFLHLNPEDCKVTPTKYHKK